MGSSVVDVHQHLWPAPLLDRLRARSRPPYVRGWTLHTAGEPPFEIEPGDHDPRTRIESDLAAGIETACLSLSAPLGIEALPRPEAVGLLDAWHTGAAELPSHFRTWVSVPVVDPDVAALATLLRQPHVVGLQLPATALGSPDAWERAARLLIVAELVDKPVMVHPGPVAVQPARGPVPSWWAPVVDYVQQMHAAWWAWHALDGRGLFPELRLVFAAGAGLAPVHHERQVMRGGSAAPVDRRVFVDSAGYGPRALDALVRTLGIDALVLGSDRPYGDPVASLFGDAATAAVRVTNPARLLAGDQEEEKGEPSWAFAS